VCGFKAAPVRGQPSPVRGTWDGFGLRLVPPATTAAAATDIDLPAGKYHVSVRLECGETCPDGAEVAVSAGGSELRRMPWPAPGSTVALTVPVTHGGGKLHFDVRVDGKFVRPQREVTSLWVSAFEVEADPR
jgi:hypothetical protein